MSAIQIVCAVAVPPCSGVINSWPSKWGVLEFSASLLPRTALPRHRAAAYSIRQKPTRQQFGPIAAISIFLGGPELRALLCWPWAGLGKHVGRRISTRHALHHPVSLAAARGEAVSNTSPPEWCLHSSASSCWQRGMVCRQTRFRCLLVVGAAFAFAVSNVLTKRYGPFDPLMLMGWSSLLTVPQVMLMSFALEHGQLASLITADEHGWLALAYTIFIGGIVGFAFGSG